MKFIDPKEWRPVGIERLEPAIEDAVRQTGNTMVVAGPGAGKTEMLAQRACFLLQTGICPRPRSILAISFKRDSARNLSDRVLERCGHELSRRFDSLTFDSFSKGLVDRFGQALPIPWRPSPDFRIDFNVKWKPITSIRLESHQSAVLWGQLVPEKRPSTLNFAMLSRLAEHILYVNPQILSALRSTYSHIFLDEFQDTTGIQYQLVKTAFLGSRAQLTAVGDPKQRIMKWAGALHGVFQQFERDFGADIKTPLLNHRSAPELVRIQQHLARALDANSPQTRAVDDGTSGAGECRILEFDDQADEAKYVGSLIRTWITEEGIPPRKICVLTRNRPAHYTQGLLELLTEIGISARVENDLQDLLSEPLTTLILNFLRLGAMKRSAEAWKAVLEELAAVRGTDTDESERLLQKQTADFLRELRQQMARSLDEGNAVSKAVERILAFVDQLAFAAHYTEYHQGDFFHTTLRDCVEALTIRLRRTRNWSLAIDDLVGADSVPIMTIHKSKGLEYHTVLFVGFEDAAFFNFSREPDEEACTFFVAFSRAEKRIFFTFCRHRSSRPGDAPSAQGRRSIQTLYKVLGDAGVHPERTGAGTLDANSLGTIQ